MSSQRSYYAFVSSDDRDYGPSPADFTCSLSNLSLGFNRNMLLGLDELYLTHLQYPVRSGANRIYFRENGGALLVATIPEGDYDLTSLAAAVASAMTAAGDLSYSASVGEASKRLTVFTTLPDEFSLDFSAADSAYRVMGFTQGTITSDQATHTGDQPAIIDGDSFLWLETNLANYNITSSSALGSRVMECIPISVPFGGIVQYSSNEGNEFLEVGEASLAQISVRLLNADGSQYRMPSNGRVVLKLRVLIDD
jgi:hypothetical protein